MKEMRNLPEKKSYAKHVDGLGEWLYAVGHYRYDSLLHVAVVILTDGHYFVGISKKDPYDNYSRKRGHEIAVGRALHYALTETEEPDGLLWKDDEPRLAGRELGQVCETIAESISAEQLMLQI